MIEIFHLRKRMSLALTSLSIHLKSSKSSFEEKMQILLDLSRKLVDESLIGIYHKGTTSVLVSPGSEGGLEMIVLSNEKDDRNLSPEVAYEQMARSIIKTVEDEEGTENSNLIRPIEWRYTDTNVMYGDIIIQVMEEYIRGRVPHDTSIMLIKDGRLPDNAFFPLDRITRATYKKIGAETDIGISFEDFRSTFYTKEHIVKDAVARVAFMCLNQFFEYFLKYRIMFRGESVYDSYKYLFSESQSAIHPVAFLTARPYYVGDFRCSSGWDIGRFISSGSYGRVFQACCEEKCEYVVKIIAPETQYETLKELDIWKKAQEINNGELVPQLVEYYYHKGNVEEKSYFLVVMEALDTSVSKAMTFADKTNNVALREILYAKMLDILRTLHANGIAHGDAHLPNFMLKCDDKSVYESGDDIYRALLSGRCKMKIIDFGFSTTIENLRKNFEKELEILHRIAKRLFSIGCVSDFEEKEFKKSAERNIEEFFKIVCFYDFALVKRHIDPSYSNSKKLFYMFNIAEREITGTKCDVNAEMEFENSK
jgi:tRNA A-37 threonylcarbamoyl transferase component Bud32